MTIYRGKRFLRSLMPFIGSVIGVGIFGLPYVFVQSGFFIGLAHLLVIGAVNLTVLLLYADIVMNSTGQARLTGYMRTFLGEHWASVASVVAFGTNWGAMLAYMILGGQFLFTLLSPLLGGEVGMYQIGFFLMSAFLLIGGLGFIAHLELVFVSLLLIALAVVLGGSVPAIDFANLVQMNATHWFLPFGVVLFAYGGFAAVPEMAEVLHGERHKLRKAIIYGTGIVGLVYLAFAGIVIAVSGTETSQDAISGLGLVVGNWVIILGSIVGFISVFTSFLLLGISVMDTMIYDYKMRYFSAWAITALVPFLVYLAGARSFISVIGITGGILGSCFGLLVILLYLRAKNHVCMPKNCLSFPSPLIYLCVAVFLLGAILTVLGLA